MKKSDTAIFLQAEDCFSLYRGICITLVIFFFSCAPTIAISQSVVVSGTVPNLFDAFYVIPYEIPGLTAAGDMITLDLSGFPGEVMVAANELFVSDYYPIVEHITFQFEPGTLAVGETTITGQVAGVQLVSAPLHAD